MKRVIPCCSMRFLFLFLTSFLLMACVPFTSASQCSDVMLSEALISLNKVETIDELMERIGPPHGKSRYEPGNKDNKITGYITDNDYLSKKMFLSSPEMINKLEYGMPTLHYDLAHPGTLTGGTLIIFHNQEGVILGWAYSKIFKDYGLIDEVCISKR